MNPSAVRVTGNRAVERMLAQLNTSKQRKQVLRVIAEQMRSMQYEHFEKEEDSQGRSWAELSEGYKKVRMKKEEKGIFRNIGKELKMSGVKIRRKGKIKGAKRSAAKHLAAMAHLPLLRDTGRLVNSLSTKVTSNDAIVGTNVEHAPSHQFGTEHIPRREFLYLNNDERRTLVERINWELVYKHLQRR